MIRLTLEIKEAQEEKKVFPTVSVTRVNNINRPIRCITLILLINIFRLVE